MDGWMEGFADNWQNMENKRTTNKLRSIDLKPWKVISASNVVKFGG